MIVADKTPPITTTNAVIPAASDENSLAAGPNGPLPLQDHYLIQKMAQFNCERIPERVVHATVVALALAALLVARDVGLFR
jgi:catalase